MKAFSHFTLAVSFLFVTGSVLASPQFKIPSGQGGEIRQPSYGFAVRIPPSASWMEHPLLLRQTDFQHPRGVGFRISTADGEQVDVTAQRNVDHWTTPDAAYKERTDLLQSNHVTDLALAGTEDVILGTLPARLYRYSYTTLSKTHLTVTLVVALRPASDAFQLPLIYTVSNESSTDSKQTGSTLFETVRSSFTLIEPKNTPN